MRILLVESNTELAQSIELLLRQEGFNLYTTDLGEEGADLAKLYDYDLVISNADLPDLSGINLLKKLRAAKISTPVIILYAGADTGMKITALGSGADDVLTLPFDHEEFIARVHAIIRRSKGHSQSIITTGKIKVNLDAKTVEVDGQRVHLTGKEYQMLELLSLRKGTTLTKEMFLNHLYGGLDEPELKIVDVFITKLRKKLSQATGGENYIETVWGRGYVLRDPKEEDDAAQKPAPPPPPPTGQAKVTTLTPPPNEDRPPETPDGGGAVIRFPQPRRPERTKSPKTDTPRLLGPPASSEMDRLSRMRRSLREIRTAFGPERGPSPTPQSAAPNNDEPRPPANSGESGPPEPTQPTDGRQAQQNFEPTRPLPPRQARRRRDELQKLLLCARAEDPFAKAASLGLTRRQLENLSKSLFALPFKELHRQQRAAFDGAPPTKPKRRGFWRRLLGG